MVKALLKTTHVSYTTHTFLDFLLFSSSTISKENDTPIDTIYILIEQLKTCSIYLERKKGEKKKEIRSLYRREG